MGTRESNDRRNLVAVNLSLAANLVLAVARTGMGILGHSPALLADGINRNDILSIATAAVGICFGRSGYPWVDPATAALVAVVIFNTGLKILRDSSSDLMDILPDDRKG